jgi:hypothetical protein
VIRNIRISYLARGELADYDVTQEEVLYLNTSQSWSRLKSKNGRIAIPISIELPREDFMGRVRELIATPHEYDNTNGTLTISVRSLENFPNGPIVAVGMFYEPTATEPFLEEPPEATIRRELVSHL